MAAGEAPANVSPAGSDEIGDLSRAFTDLSAELEVSRERLLQAERVAAWREMARRLAHELKNPIFPIQLSIETLRRALAQDEQAGRFGELFRNPPTPCSTSCARCAGSSTSSATSRACPSPAWRRRTRRR
jgi:signal transduction histidine kinase